MAAVRFAFGEFRAGAPVLHPARGWQVTPDFPYLVFEKQLKRDIHICGAAISL
ncbi:hypothetical protein [Streptomyces buecherae]|uniref:hypothetical protein n=1 Tax=Streptomyces buecherae TaxID=2763006 RepID=UPI0036C66D2E